MVCYSFAYERYFTNFLAEASKKVFRETGGVSFLLSVASSRNGAHLLALQALAKLAENNG